MISKLLYNKILIKMLYKILLWIMKNLIIKNYKLISLLIIHILMLLIFIMNKFPNFHINSKDYI